MVNADPRTGRSRPGPGASSAPPPTSRWAFVHGQRHARQATPAQRCGS